MSLWLKNNFRHWLVILKLQTKLKFNSNRNHNSIRFCEPESMLLKVNPHSHTNVQKAGYKNCLIIVVTENWPPKVYCLVSKRQVYNQSSGKFGWLLFYSWHIWGSVRFSNLSILKIDETIEVVCHPSGSRTIVKKLNWFNYKGY